MIINLYQAVRNLESYLRVKFLFLKNYITGLAYIDVIIIFFYKFMNITQIRTNIIIRVAQNDIIAEKELAAICFITGKIRLTR